MARRMWEDRRAYMIQIHYTQLVLSVNIVMGHAMRARLSPFASRMNYKIWWQSTPTHTFTRMHNKNENGSERTKRQNKKKRTKLKHKKAIKLVVLISTIHIQARAIKVAQNHHARTPFHFMHAMLHTFRFAMRRILHSHFTFACGLVSVHNRSTPTWFGLNRFFQPVDGVVRAYFKKI